jgi:kinetochore protein Mis13/DSN1
LPEPIRCRHLLVFCAKRAADEHIATGKVKGKSKEKAKSRYQGERTDEGDRLVKEIMDSFLSGLGKGEVETNVFASGVSA